MTTPGPKERIRIAIAEEAKKLLQATGQSADRATPAPGDLYVFDVGKDVGLEWLVVRFHPDDPKLVLLAPIDDFPLTGTPDLVLPPESVGRPLTVRCGETDWFPATLCVSRLRTGTVPEHVLTQVRQRLADVARGRSITTTDPSVDFDPEYEEWMSEVTRARDSLLARAESVQTEAVEVVPLAVFSTTPPAQLAHVPEFSLAAESGGPLFAALGKALAEANDVKYHEIPDVPGGKLFLLVDAAGVRVVWEGSLKLAPPTHGVSGSGEETLLSWQSGPEGRLHQTERHALWVDGLATLVIGTTPRRTLAIEL